MVDWAYKVAAYRKFIHWTYNRVGKGICKVIPYYVVVDEFPEDNGVYTGFKLAEL